jgi:fluoride exporter
MNRYLLVMLGAALGGLARYVIGSSISQQFEVRFAEVRFPLGTLIVNVSGCFLIGVLMAWFVGRGDPNPALRLLLVTGFLGGYTTFSSFGWETFEAVQKDTILTGLMNVVLSVVLGYLAVWGGSSFTSWVTRAVTR